MEIKICHKKIIFNFIQLFFVHSFIQMVSQNLIANYLTNRKIKVKVNDALSESQEIDVGVPQGSVLGPLLFIIYFNDFNFLQTKSKNFLYADDTTMSCFGHHIDLIIKKLEDDLKLVEEWLNHN